MKTTTSAARPLNVHIYRKRALPLIGIGLLAGCVAVTKPLWRSDIEVPETAWTKGMAQATDNSLYQGYESGGNAWLRRLQTDGTELWKQEIGSGNISIDATTQNGAVIPTDAEGAIVFHGGAFATRINGDGSPRWTQQVLPSGAKFKTWSRFHDNRIYVMYESPSEEGVKALDGEGNGIWTYNFKSDSNDKTRFFRESLAVLNTGEMLLTITAQGGVAPYDYKGNLYAFSAQGALLQSREVLDFAQLVDNQNSVFLLGSGNLTRLDVSGDVVWTRKLYDPAGSTLNPPCVGDGDQEIACAYAVKVTDFGYENVTTWFAADGNPRNEYRFPMVTFGYNGIGGLYFIGNHQWVLKKKIEQELPVLQGLPGKTEFHDSLVVLGNEGRVLQTINMESSVLSEYFCGSIYVCERYTKVGDNVLGVYGDATQVYVVGDSGKNSGTSQGFISAYKIAK